MLLQARAEFMTRDRFSWMRFLGFGLNDTKLYENTIRHFRDRQTADGTIGRHVPSSKRIRARGTICPLVFPS
jgi:hypothetical protein